MIDFDNMETIMKARAKFEDTLDKLGDRTRPENRKKLLEYQAIDIDTFGLYLVNQEYSDMQNSNNRKYVKHWFDIYNIGRGRV